MAVTRVSVFKADLGEVLRGLKKGYIEEIKLFLEHQLSRYAFTAFVGKPFSKRALYIVVSYTCTLYTG